MDIFLFDQQKFALLYNCSSYSVEEIPLEDRRQILLGTISIVLFFIFQMLYVPCALVLWRHIQHSSFKIMFCIALVDINALFMDCLFTGIFGIYGIVFCSYPNLMFAVGIDANFNYSFETMAAVLLAGNRCLNMTHPKMAKSLFHGNRTWIWLAFVCVYSICFAFFDKICLFNSITFGWQFNPHVGYIDGIDDLYTSSIELFHDIAVPSLILLFYFLFMISFLRKHLINSKILGKEKKMHSNTTKIVFLQVFLISLLNSIITISFLLLMFSQCSTQLFSLFGTFGCQLLHGLPPALYFTVNRTLRDECRQMFKVVSNLFLKRKNSNANDYNKKKSSPAIQISPAILVKCPLKITVQCKYLNGK